MNITSKLFSHMKTNLQDRVKNTNYATELAQFHNWLGLKKTGKSLLPDIRDYSSYIKDSYPEINEYYSKTQDVIPASEWYLDNYYLINELINGLNKDLSKQHESKLSYLASGDSAGLARIYVLVSEYIKSMDKELDFQHLKSFIAEYQTEAPLSSAEIWAIPLMLKIIMLEQIFYQTERIIYIQKERKLAENWLDTVFGQGNKEIELPEQEVDHSNFSPVFIERIARKLKEHGPDAKVLFNWLDNMAGKQNLSVEKVISSEHHFLTSQGLIMGNIIASLKMINSENWSEFFEGVSLVQQVLQNDPAGIFQKMDFESRDKYRHEIEKLAEKYNVSELTVAKTIEDTARWNQESPLNHVGYYLCGQGRAQLERELTADWGKVRQSFQGLLSFYKHHPVLVYLGAIGPTNILMYLLLLGFTTRIAIPGGGAYLLFLISAFILLNGIAVYFVNRVFCKILPTSFLPKLDFRKGIPAEYKTAVVIPAIFDNAAKVREQLQLLEIHYLNNQEDNLYFALLGDYCDAPKESMPGDNEIIIAGMRGVQKLNSKYGKDKFFYLHRSRKWNVREKTWMGWERKRGKLLEFNKLLLQDGETSYICNSDKRNVLSGVQYVITLDADTILPRNTARRLIGTISHPMQKAKMDSGNKKVIYGYGIIQPRIGLTAASAYATPFSAMFTGSAGLDPYTCAISDIYQDLFGEGIYTGKGIYDLRVFHAVTRDSFPENTILSHDLIEGLHARTGLATDIELFDGYPTKYLSFTKRNHRWIRGDWQIARYIFNRNLSVISRWKIIDNLRRSLEVPLQLLTLFLAFTYLHVIFGLLAGIVLLSLSLPLILNIIESLVNRSLTARILKHELRLGMSQILFMLAVLPYQALTQIDAIIRSIVRQAITKKSLLEWEPAAVSENSLELTPKNSYALMYKGIALSLLFLLGFYFVNVFTGILLSILIMAWLSSPWIAYRLSLAYQEKSQGMITSNDRMELRKWARQIWAFFDSFVSKENNYLPPDNVQLEPYKGEARRTSPTNIGLAVLANLAAEDLGYITKKTMLNRIRLTLGVIRKIPKWNGHIYNWYNTESLEPLHPIYISTVDSGNLAAYLIALKNGLRELSRRPIIEKTLLDGLADTFNLIDKNAPIPSEIEEFGRELNTITAQERFDLRRCYQFILGSLKRLKAFEKDIEQIKDKNLGAYDSDFWLTSLIRQLESYQDVIELVYPYVKFDELNLDFTALSKGRPALLIKEYRKLLTKGKDILPPILVPLLKKAIKNCTLILLWSARLRRQLNKTAYSMDFKPLFDEQKGLFSIGYNLSEQRLDKSYYDLLASEARQTSLLAIAKGDVPQAHWFKLARPLTRIEGRRSLISWSGTMFEFLMPLILLKNYRGTLMNETYQSVVGIQQLHAEKAQAPWGISESGFFSYDIQTNYQYKAFGVPGLGLKRGLAKDMVISPYSTFMALAVDQKAGIENLKLMKSKGFNGVYGLYEAIDYTKARVPYHEEFSIVKSYMSHHQGMSLISLNNTLNNNIMQQRFHREPRIKSIELLLQEQVPLKEYTYNPSIEEVKEEKIPAVSRQYAEKPAVYLSPDTNMPRPGFISNREYSVMLTLTGSGYSKYNDIHVTRWREDPTLDMYGSYLYIQNLNSGNVWSATYKPLNYSGEDYKVTCFPNNMKFFRKDGNIITRTEVFVAPEDPVEIRKVSLTNQSKYSRDIQLTSYMEVVLDQLKADSAHPAFSKLFIQTRYENNTLVAFRRPRHHDGKKLFLMHTLFAEGELLGELEYETDRTKFIGRGRTLSNPKALDFNHPLSNTVGAVLDPIMSLRTRVRIDAGKTAVFYFLTGVGDKKEAVLNLAEKYRSSHTIEQAIDLAWSQNLMELTNLDLSFDEANMISGLAAHVIFPGPLRRNISIKNNKLGQSSLWQFGISGDLPIVLLKIQDNSQLRLVDQMLKIHEYWKIKGLFIDLVILNEDKTGYFQTIQDIIQEKISISHVRKLVNQPGGVFVLKKDQLTSDAVQLIHAVARIVFSGENGSLNNQISKFKKLAEHNPGIEKKGKNLKKEVRLLTPGTSESQARAVKDNLVFYNGYGGFSADGKEYVIVMEKDNYTPLPWVNVIANPYFGTIVTEAGAGYSWSQNSREYRLSPWSNDPLLDIGGEGLYLRDEKTGSRWSPVPMPIKDEEPYIIRHGQGYSSFEHTSNGLNQQTTIYIPPDKNIKIVKLTLSNLTVEAKSLSAYYYLEWVLGVNREQNAPYLVTELRDDILFCRNVYQEEFAGRAAFLCAYGGSFKSCTADRKDFIGVNRNLHNPVGLQKEKLGGKSGNGLDPCGVIQIGLDLKPQEEKTIYFLLGDEKDYRAAISLATEFRNETLLTKAYQEVISYWDKVLTTIQITTPEKTLDLLFNRWLIYQVLVCRLWARSAFYQSGGAIGFRDQLQDVMSLSLISPELARKQIIIHSSRQFLEGDVQHWWHPEKGKGIRTRFTDDLLWLPFVTADYIEHTGDESVLDETTPFLNQELLGEDEDERYAIPTVSEDFVTVYEHCVRAIDHSLKFGEHGLPLIGTGDWNDGFSAIGREGKGESVWLGWFQLSTLKEFLPICEKRGDLERAEKYRGIIKTLTENIEKNAWDGAWYRRAYYDDGSPLGSISNTECQIDSIAQSWAIISGSGRESRAKDAMSAVESYLWDKDESLLKLFTPPFDKTDKNPGYIRGYIPGVRENGGQYTHAAIWSILALTKLGERNKALELFNALNPINHSRTNTEVLKYKVEPYVIAADVYTVNPNVGRGGWTWYTGAAGWMYQAALKGILGFNLKENKLSLSPCVPLSWQEYIINYRYKTSEYNITVKFNSKDKGIIVDGVKQEYFPIHLHDDGLKHIVEVYIDTGK